MASLWLFSSYREKIIISNIVSDRLSLSTADIFTVAAVSVATRAVDLDI